jgi:hypothetical protein
LGGNSHRLEKAFLAWGIQLARKVGVTTSKPTKSCDSGGTKAAIGFHDNGKKLKVVGCTTGRVMGAFGSFHWSGGKTTLMSSTGNRGRGTRVNHRNIQAGFTVLELRDVDISRTGSIMKEIHGFTKSD